MLLSILTVLGGVLLIINAGSALSSGCRTNDGCDITAGILLAICGLAAIIGGIKLWP